MLPGPGMYLLSLNRALFLLAKNNRENTLSRRVRFKATDFRAQAGRLQGSQDRSRNGLQFET